MPFGPITFPFDIDDTVQIIGLACHGRIVGFYIDEARTIWIRVRFTINTGEPKEDYMLEKDLIFAPAVGTVVK